MWKNNLEYTGIMALEFNFPIQQFVLQDQIFPEFQIHSQARWIIPGRFITHEFVCFINSRTLLMCGSSACSFCQSSLVILGPKSMWATLLTMVSFGIKGNELSSTHPCSKVPATSLLDHLI